MKLLDEINPQMNVANENIQNTTFSLFNFNERSSNQKLYWIIILEIIILIILLSFAL